MQEHERSNADGGGSERVRGHEVSEAGEASSEGESGLVDLLARSRASSRRARSHEAGHGREAVRGDGPHLQLAGVW